MIMEILACMVLKEGFSCELLDELVVSVHLDLILYSTTGNLACGVLHKTTILRILFPLGCISGCPVAI